MSKSNTLKVGSLVNLKFRGRGNDRRLRGVLSKLRVDDHWRVEVHVRGSNPKRPGSTIRKPFLWDVSAIAKA